MYCPHCGERVEQPKAVFRLGNVVLDQAKKRVTVNGERRHLTPGEYAVLEHLIRRPGVVFNKEQLMIAAEAWTATERMIVVWIHRIRRALAGATVQIVSRGSLGYMIEPGEMELPGSYRCRPLVNPSQSSPQP